MFQPPSKSTFSPLPHKSFLSVFCSFLDTLNSQNYLFGWRTLGDVVEISLRCSFKNEGLDPLGVNSLHRQRWLKGATSPKPAAGDWCRHIKGQPSHPNSGQLRATLSSEFLVGLAVTSIETASLLNFTPCPILLSLFLFMAIELRSTPCTQIFISESASWAFILKSFHFLLSWKRGMACSIVVTPWKY